MPTLEYNPEPNSCYELTFRGRTSLVQVSFYEKEQFDFFCRDIMKAFYMEGYFKSDAWMKPDESIELPVETTIAIVGIYQWAYYLTPKGVLHFSREGGENGTMIHRIDIEMPHDHAEVMVKSMGEALANACPLE